MACSWPKSYHLRDKEGFAEDETYYFGIRIKRAITNDGEEEGKDAQQQPQQIDLSAVRDKFYNLMLDLAYDQQRPDSQYMEPLSQGRIDIDVSCKSRDELPEAVIGPPKQQ